MKDTVRKGTITETKAILKFLEMGYNVFIPYGNGSKCDLIIENLEKFLYKIQCKTSRLERKNVVCNAYSTARTRSTSGEKLKVKYTKKDIDFFCTFDLENNMYLIPVDVVKTQNIMLKVYKEYIVK